MGQFANAVAKFATKTTNKYDLALQKISLELFSRIVLRTPVDEGRARGNWLVSIGSVPNGTIEFDDPSGRATISRATAEVAGIRAGQTVFLTNGLPYIQRLEDGYSGQAPSGMVGLSVQEFQDIANQVGIELVRL